MNTLDSNLTNDEDGVTKNEGRMEEKRMTIKKDKLVLFTPVSHPVRRKSEW
jgi:hypothetical protein